MANPGQRLNRRFRKHIEEYLVIVGGPSNTFNGYYHYDAIHDKDVPEPAPSDSSPAQIRRYIKGDPALTNPDEQTESHDVYWANFIYSAVKLIETGIVRPQPGDILTFIICLRPYELRAKVDWQASPWNLQLHRNSPWVAGKDPYDSTIRLAEQGTLGPSSPRGHPNGKTAQTVPPTFSHNEHVINHEILMRTTGEYNKNTGKPLPDGGFHKRPHSPQDYIDAILLIPWRIAYGSQFGEFPPSPKAPPLTKVFVKLLFLRSIDDLYAYILNGTWTGNRYLHLLETHDEKDIANQIPLDEASWYGLAFLKGSPPHPEWQSLPTVDRTKVKIKRLDYFGHSGPDDLFLQYGWTNKKGEKVPEGEVLVPKEELDSRLTSDLFTSDSFAHLWGCNLGEGMAPVIARTVKRVRACNSSTNYDPILAPDDPYAMPIPLDPVHSPWQDFTVP